MWTSTVVPQSNHVEDFVPNHFAPFAENVDHMQPNANPFVVRDEWVDTSVEIASEQSDLRDVCDQGSRIEVYCPADEELLRFALNDLRNGTPEDISVYEGRRSWGRFLKTIVMGLVMN